MSLATRISTRQCSTLFTRSIAHSARASFAQTMPTEQPANPKAKPPIMKEFKTHRLATKKAKGAGPRYYAFLPKIDLKDVVEGVMNSNTELPETARVFWKHVKRNSRIAGQPHITIVHKNSKEHERDLWMACEDLTQGSPSLFEFKLGHLVWNDRVMALAVENLSIVAGSGGKDKAQNFLTRLDEDGDVRGRLHITIGTKEPSIPPVEAKTLVEDWRAGKEINAIPLENVVARGRVKGLIH